MTFGQTSGIQDININHSIFKGEIGTAGNGFQALLMSFLVILVSEIGDKTFLIAAVMAMTHSRFLAPDNVKNLGIFGGDYSTACHDCTFGRYGPNTSSNNI